MRRIIATLALIALASACAQDTDTQTGGEVTPKDGPTITIGSADFTESKVLGEIYAQGLAAKGYETDTKDVSTREVYFPALEEGEIDFFPEYTGSLLSYLTEQKTTASPDSDTTYQDVTSELEGRDVTLLEYAPAQDKDGIVTNMETADEYDLEKISDLEPHASKLVFGGPPECQERQACLKGLKDVYGMEFKSFTRLKSGQPTVQALKANEIQVANIFTTDSAIVGNDFVVLEDDKGPIAGAENIVPAVRTEITEAYGATFAEDVNAVTAKITTEKLLELNGRVDLEKEDAEDVAEDFLESEGLA